MLGEPDGVIARLVHDGKALEPRLVDRVERHGPVTPAEELQNADFHFTLPHPRNRPLGRQRLMPISDTWITSQPACVSKAAIDRGPDKALTLLPSGCGEVRRTPTTLRFKP